MRPCPGNRDIEISRAISQTQRYFVTVNAARQLLRGEAGIFPGHPQLARAMHQRAHQRPVNGTDQ
jgi:hypothetical protein